MKLYFGALDSLRTYAFLLVFVSHTYFSFFHTSDVYTKIFAHGEVGVHIFFVLSAFLITYLSLVEYKKTGGFNIVYFFKKRILRIWPVYGIVLGVSYLWNLYSMPGTFGCMYSFLYFFGNTCMVQGLPAVDGAKLIGPMWSVSVEQQFYVVFPIALLMYVGYMKKIHTHIRAYLLHGVLGVVFVWSLYMRYVYAYDWDYVSYATVSSLPPFIVGMYLAYSIHKGWSGISRIQRYPRVYMISAHLALLAGIYGKFLGSLGISLYILPIMYATCVYISVGVSKKETGLDVRVSPIQTATRYLGKISYGLYAYHMIAIVFLQRVFPEMISFSASLIAFGITTALAYLSYTYIESWFLKFK